MKNILIKVNGGTIMLKNKKKYYIKTLTSKSFVI